MLKTQSMNLDYIRTFVVVSQSKDFREAATKLNIDHTNVSRHIKNLEELLETKLINRNEKNFITLTEDGQKLASGWSEAYNLILLAEKKLLQEKNIDSGKISLGVSGDIEIDLVSNKIKEFKNKYPNVVLKVVNSNTKDLFEKLDNFYLDFVIDEKYDNVKKSSDFNYKLIYKEDYCIAYSKDFFDKIENEEQLNNKPLILPVSLNQDRSKFEEFLSERKIPKKLSMEVSSYEASIVYAKLGLGLALVPKKMVSNTDLEYLDIPFEKNVYISYVNGNLSPSAKEFLKLFE